MSKPGKPVVLGFMTVRPTEEGLRGGYLLTTEYGRPIEFHYTSELIVTPSQRAIYGSHFEPYVFAEVMGRPLTERQRTPPQAIVVNRLPFLELRRFIPAPMIHLERPAADADLMVRAHESHPTDADLFPRMKELVPIHFDWMEPFERITAALAEIKDANLRLSA